MNLLFCKKKVIIMYKKWNYMLQLNQEGRGTKCMKQEEKEYRVGTHATSIGHQIKLTHKAFDSKYFKGNQRKGFIFF